MAAVMSMHGHEVSIIKLTDAIHNENFEALRKKTIQLSGIEGEGEFPLDRVTKEPSEAIPDAELVLVYYVSNYHEFVAERIASYLHDKQGVVLNPGYGGSLIFEKAMRAAGKDKMPIFAEFETLPYSCRIVGPAQVEISSKNVRHPFAAYPSSKAGEFIERFQQILGELVPRKNILEASLHNPNLLIHTTGIIMNAAQVEHPDKRFAMYRDAFSESIWKLIGQLDNEKMDVLEKIGCPRIPYIDEFRLRTFKDTSIDFPEGFKHYANEAPTGPFTVDHRYVTEDVPMGLGLLHSLGKATQVATPICDSLIHIASAMLPHLSIWDEIRTVEKLWDGKFTELLDALNA